MIIPVLGIPILNRSDLLKRCIESIDYPVDKLVIIDNSDCDEFNRQIRDILEDTSRVNRNIKRFKHVIHPNKGCAGSWNEIIMEFPAPWWMIVGNDIQFNPGDLEKMYQETVAHPEASFLFANHGHSFFVWTVLGVKTVGLADHNIYPAYCEDLDLSRRVSLVGAVCVNVQGINAVHGEAPSWGSSTIFSNQSYRAQNGGTHGRNWRYYVHKWGGMPGEEKHKTPFGLSCCPIDYFPFNPEFRAAQQWKKE